MSYNEFEMFVPSGYNCITSYQLRRMKLQFEALPFDWVGEVNLDLAVCFMENHFDGFIEKDSLVPFADEQKFTKTFGMPSGIKFIHDFSSYDLEAEYDSVASKYKRRIERFYKKISKAASILFVHCTSVDYEIDKLLSLQQRLSKLFRGKKVKLLYVHLDSNVEGFHYALTTPSLDIVEINKGKSDGWMGNNVLFSELLANYKLEYKNSRIDVVKAICRRSFLKILVALVCCCLPRKKRHQLKRWYKQSYGFFKG